MDNNETSTAYYRQMYQSYRMLPVLFASFSVIFLAVCILVGFIFLAIEELLIPAFMTLIFGGAFCVLVFLFTKHLLSLSLSPMVVLIDTVINIENKVDALLPEDKKAKKTEKKHYPKASYANNAKLEKSGYAKNPKDEKHDNAEKSTATTSTDSKPDHFEMECPECENVLYLDRRWDDLNEFICPFCDTKLAINPEQPNKTINIKKH